MEIPDEELCVQIVVIDDAKLEYQSLSADGHGSEISVTPRASHTEWVRVSDVPEKLRGQYRANACKCPEDMI